MNPDLFTLLWWHDPFQVLYSNITHKCLFAGQNFNAQIVLLL